MRELSVALGLLVGLGAVLSAPLGVVLYAPLLLGVAHVAGDALVLLVDPPRPVGRWMWGGVVGLMVGSWLLYAVGGPDGADLALAISAIMLGAATGAGGPGRRAAWGAAALLLAGVAWWSPWATRLAMAHLHNLVGMGMLVAWSRAARWSLLLLAGAVAGAAALLAGLFDPLLGSLLTPQAASVAGALAPGLDAALAARVVAVYALLQLLHYGVWMGWAPAMRPGAWRWLPWAAAAALLPTLLLLAWGADDPVQARTFYLSAAGFHGWMELALLAHLGGGRAAD